MRVGLPEVKELAIAVCECRRRRVVKSAFMLAKRYKVALMVFFQVSQYLSLTDKP
jgi:hypothetical protein